MASYTIETRKLKSGEPRFKVTIIVKKNSRIIHRESKTLKKKALAKAFGKKRFIAAFRGKPLLSSRRSSRYLDTHTPFA